MVQGIDLQIVGHVSPVVWALDGMTVVTYEGAHVADVWIPLAVLLGMVVWPSASPSPAFAIT